MTPACCSRATLAKTTNIPLALSKGINVALAPDWSLGGSINLLDELRFTNHVDDTQWGDMLSAKDLTDMVTTNAARVLGLEGVLGSIEAGKKADLLVINGDRCAPHEALVAANPSDVRLVMVAGKVLYGDSALESAGTGGCEALNVCGANKFVCVAAPSQSATDKFGQKLSDITSTLEAALAAYDAQNLSQWDFAPLAPLVKCE